ncbi:MAG: thiamine-phosphate kinase [Candidatus Melainabacteria bacterium]|nr:thiamine-phosphate kinase [Candidatus Melainabacteria bacterium]
MMTEQAVLQQIKPYVQSAPWLADDAYVEEQTGYVYTTDLFVEGRHFDRAYYAPQHIGWKTAAAAISDIAATGAKLQHILISLALPETVDEGFVSAFYRGVSDLLQTLEVGQLVGGDTVGSPLMAVNVTAIGKMPRWFHPGRRSQAQPGDVLIATGYHGLSAAGMIALRQGLEGMAVACEAHLKPLPRLKQGLFLSGRFPRYALMDSSDGLADAALKLSAASRVRVVIDIHQLPIHNDLKILHGVTREDPLRLALYGGEDYELVAAVPLTPAQIRDLPEGFRVIGHVEPYREGQANAVLINGTTQEVLEELSFERTYQHFSSSGHFSAATTPYDSDGIPPKC